MTARITEGTQIGAVDQGFAQPVVQSDRGWDGCRGQHGAVKPAGDQAGDGDGPAQHHGRKLGAWSSKPRRQALMVVKPGNNRRIDGMIEWVRHGLVREDYPEHHDENDAAGQQGGRPETSGADQ